MKDYFRGDTADLLFKELVEERKVGKWIKDEEESAKHVEPVFLCSNCNNFEAWGIRECYPFCPNCGAKMEG